MTTVVYRPQNLSRQYQWSYNYGNIYLVHVLKNSKALCGKLLSDPPQFRAQKMEISCSKHVNFVCSKKSKFYTQKSKLNAQEMEILSVPWKICFSMIFHAKSDNSMRFCAQVEILLPGTCDYEKVESWRDCPVSIS